MTTATLTATASISTFSITGGLAAEYIERGEMIPWSGTLVIEGGDTGDRRFIEKGALTMRKLPMPFMVQLENPVGGDGHDGATLTGRIDTLDRLDDGRWWATGFIDPTMQDGTTLALALDKQLIRGVSVDLDQVEITEVKDKAGNVKQVITAARIIGGTATPFQAFTEAEIQLDVDRMNIGLAASADFAEWENELGDGIASLASVWTPTDGIETIVAHAGRSIPVDPPLAWFAKRKFTALTPLTVEANGQVFGHIAAWGTCHISFANRCQPVPRSHTNYAAFRTNSVLTAEGTVVRTGPIVMDTVHPDTRWKADAAMSFYAHTGAAVCDVVPYEDEFGIAVVGAMRPDVSPAVIRAFRGSDISPDWRTINGNKHECCALLAVNNSGFKLPQALLASAGMYVEPGDTAIALDPFGEVYALVASGPLRPPGPCCAECAASHDALVASAGDSPVDELERTARLAAVRAQFGPSRETRIAAMRARFAVEPPRFRSFRIAGVTVFDRDASIKAWQTRDRGAGGERDISDSIVDAMEEEDRNRRPGDPPLPLQKGEDYLVTGARNRRDDDGGGTDLSKWADNDLRATAANPYYQSGTMGKSAEAELKRRGQVGPFTLAGEVTNRAGWEMDGNRAERRSDEGKATVTMNDGGDLHVDVEPRSQSKSPERRDYNAGEHAKALDWADEMLDRFGRRKFRQPGVPITVLAVRK